MRSRRRVFGFSGAVALAILVWVASPRTVFGDEMIGSFMIRARSAGSTEGTAPAAAGSGQVPAAELPAVEKAQAVGKAGESSVGPVVTGSGQVPAAELPREPKPSSREVNSVNELGVSGLAQGGADDKRPDGHPSGEAVAKDLGPRSKGLTPTQQEVR